MKMVWPISFYFRIISILIVIKVVFSDSSIQTPMAIDCKWSSWVEQGCSATCGKDAMRTKSRRKLQEASHGGRNCRGATIFVTPCNLPRCKNLGHIGKKIL